MAEGRGGSADKADERGQLGRAVGWAICVARGAGQLKVGKHRSGEVGEVGSELCARGPAATTEHDDGLCHDQESRSDLLASIGVSTFSKVL